uniref:Uncharacterized protein n=1 Tax=Salmo trutta TaxID=8032 RepID=A0A673VMW2_SALTR
ISSTLIIMSEVPDFGGFPPSTAVSVSWITGCFSRSKAFFLTSNSKFSLGLSVYLRRLFAPTSGSRAASRGKRVPCDTRFSAISKSFTFSGKLGE